MVHGVFHTFFFHFSFLKNLYKIVQIPKWNLYKFCTNNLYNFFQNPDFPKFIFYFSNIVFSQPSFYIFCKYIFVDSFKPNCCVFFCFSSPKHVADFFMISLSNSSKVTARLVTKKQNFQPNILV